MLRVTFSSALALLGACAGTATDPLSSWNQLDDFERDWYSRHLLAAGEPALPSKSRSTIVRLTWLRTFHNPIVVRVECKTACMVASVRLSGRGGYDPGGIAESHRSELSHSEEDEFRQLISEVLNDEHPVEIDQTLQMDAGDVKEIVVHADGAQWVVEVVDVSGYIASSTHGRDLRENGQTITEQRQSKVWRLPTPAP
jgi:hypothetical protein